MYPELWASKVAFHENGRVVYKLIFILKLLSYTNKLIRISEDLKLMICLK